LGVFGGGQGLSWAVEPRKEERRKYCKWQEIKKARSWGVMFVTSLFKIRDMVQKLLGNYAH
jgi:hypothetical protein